MGQPTDANATDYTAAAASLYSMPAPTQAPSMPSMSFSSGSRTGKAPQNSPCDTLFVWNLGPYSTAGTLEPVFKQMAGFAEFKFTSKPDGRNIAFIKFSSVDAASQAFPQVAGQQLDGSDGIKCDFAKTLWVLVGGISEDPEGKPPSNSGG